MEEETLTAEEQETLDAHKKMLDEKMSKIQSDDAIESIWYWAMETVKRKVVWDLMTEIANEEDENPEEVAQLTLMEKYWKETFGPLYHTFYGLNSQLRKINRLW